MAGLGRGLRRIGRGGSSGDDSGGDSGGGGIADLFSENSALIIVGIGVGLAVVAVVFMLLKPAKVSKKARKREDAEEPTRRTRAEDDEPEPLTPENDPRRKDGPVEGPPDEEFWERYNKRLEFPLATVATVLLHVLIGALLIYVLTQLLARGPDRSDVGIKLMSVGGMDDFGDGSAGSGGQPDPLVERLNQDPATAAVASLADPTKLPEIKEEMQNTIRLIDPTGNLPITNANAAAYEALDKSVRDKLLGANRGAGNEKGKGFDNSKGTGPGGTGANSTLGRNMRWTLRFKVNSGRDYVDQLRAMGARIIVPIPGTEQSILVEDLGNPNRQRTVGNNALGEYANLLKFVDSRRDAVNGVLGTLGLGNSGATAFCAVFTKEIEADLARKETNYRNRRAEDIEETVFRVIVRGGEFETVVDEQKAKR